MKKKTLFVLLLVPFAITGCSLDFSKTLLDEGLNGSGYVADPEKIEYYEGDTFDPSLFSSYEITSKTMAEIEAGGSEYTALETFIDENKTEEVKNSFNDSLNHLMTVGNIHYVSHANEGLEIGHLATKYFGTLSLQTDISIKYIEVTAHPRVGVVATEFGYEDRVDQNVAISVNESKFISLKSDVAYNNTICKFVASQNANATENNINIRVFGNRAIISKVTLYY